MSKKKDDKPKIDKEDFIDFLCHATPQEVNDMILTRGKPRKLYSPFYVFRNKEESNTKMEETSYGKDHHD